MSLLALPSSLLVLLFSLVLQPSLTDAISLRPNRRSTPAPQPLSFPPSTSFLGNDGPWSGFELRLGTPPQNVDVFVATTGSETFVVGPGGCQPADPSNCPLLRGNIFTPSESSSWDFKGNYTLSFETILGFDPNDWGEYGFDDLALGWQGSGLQTLHNQTIASTTVVDFWVGIFGISPYPTNLSGYNLDDSNPTYLQTLKDQDLIPSLTWGYTAGAQYRLKQAPASLTLGGYDTSLFAPSGVSFDFAPDNNADLSLWVQSITYTNNTHKNMSLLPSGSFLTFIDSTASAIWLPQPACTAFEQAFGLTWNDTYGYYLVDDALHNTLTASNPNVTFTVANDQGSGPTVNITLPYAAFDKTLEYGIGLSSGLPSLTSQRYFPLQRANSSQYTLGKTFLQEGYIITDYERRNFSVSPCIWNEGAPQNLTSICSTNATGCTSPMGSGRSATSTHHASSGFGAGAIAGTVVGILALVSILLLLVICLRRRRRSKSEPKEDLTASDSSCQPDPGTAEEVQQTHPLATELEGDFNHVVEMRGSLAFPVQLADGTTKLRIDYYGEDHQDEVHELPAELGMQRANSRAINRSRNSSGNRRHRSRHDSTGQGSVSNVSELSSDGDTGAATRPTVSHQRQASDQSDTSRVSDLSSRVDGVGVPSPAGEQSPMTPGSGVMTPVDRPELE